ncbi:HalOD1 output domain-containing protein [Natrinema salsiterrestre]|uniref:Halobacterial output domain-containing protein n=1 Tax=Natrinema salsiterrestre TaxID=2950540 RepID=A0A9Q4L0D8_9EURY|nr:HalOD1 output domain-containing protein [Natrinema salsiterrestre]MDF9744979.1 hypothetical protein [Natrinema salsiterrestre]
MSNDTAHSDSPSARSLGTDSSAYDPIGDSSHSQFDDGSEVILAIVDAVAAATDRDLTAMSPLYDTVDPESLTDLVTSARDRPIEVSFTYEGCRVTVSSDGGVVVDPAEN